MHTEARGRVRHYYRLRSIGTVCKAVALDHPACWILGTRARRGQRRRSDDEEQRRTGGSTRLLVAARAGQAAADSDSRSRSGRQLCRRPRCCVRDQTEQLAHTECPNDGRRSARSALSSGGARTVERASGRGPAKRPLTAHRKLAQLGRRAVLREGCFAVVAPPDRLAGGRLGRNRAQHRCGADVPAGRDECVVRKHRRLNESRRVAKADVGNAMPGPARTRRSGARRRALGVS